MLCCVVIPTYPPPHQDELRRLEAERREAERNRHKEDREREKELELIRKQYLVGPGHMGGSEGLCGTEGVWVCVGLSEWAGE